MTRQLQSNGTATTRRSSRFIAPAFIALVGWIAPAAAGPISVGDLVVVRIGDGSTALGSAAFPVFLDEFTTSGGAPVNTIALPTAVSGSNKRLTNSGSATSEGNLTLSANGLYLLHVGYDAPVGTLSVASTTSAATNRVVARTDLSGAVDTTTALGDSYSINNARSAASSNGIDIWLGGQGTSTDGGVRYTTLGSTTSTQLNSTATNIRVVNVLGGQLYASSGTSAFRGINAVGAGLPTTSGQTVALLGTGWNTANSPSPYDYAFLDSNTLYLADDSSTAGGGGIQKWVLSAGAWTRSYVLSSGLTAGCRGLTLGPAGANPVLFATTADASLNKLVMVTDTGPASTFSILATASTNTIFRGVRYISGCTAAPAISGPGQPVSAGVCPGDTANFTVAATGSASFTYQWRRGTSPLANGPTGAGSVLSGVNTATLTITNAQAADADAGYNCRVSNNCGSTDSGNASLTVRTTCDDGDPCTLDLCAAGECTHIFQDADADGVCDASDACPNTPVGEAVNAQGCSCSQVPLCDDNDPCTLDTCNAGECSFIHQDSDADGVCDADDACPATPSGEPVNADGCSCSQIPGCDDADPCTIDTCVGGLCQHTPIVCDDSDPCTLDTCDAGDCVYTFLDADADGVCDADDACPDTPSGETVNAQGCSCSQIPGCDDADPCTIDSCVDGACLHTPMNCDDNDPCTLDGCVSGVCVNTPINCDDNDPCTIDTCDAGACIHTPTGSCGQLSLHVVGTGLACAGHTQDVTIDVSGLSQAINGVQVLLHYDPARLSLTSVSPGNGTGSPWDAATSIALIDNAGDVAYALALFGSASSAGATVATLHFAVLPPGPSLEPTSVVFRPDQGPQQTLLTVASDNSTIQPGTTNSGPITIGPRLTVTLQVQGLNHPVTRQVNFLLTNCANPGSPQSMTRSVAFDEAGMATVILPGVDPGSTFLAVAEGHTLQRRVPLSFDACFAAASLTGASQLISGDLQTEGVPQDNLVDILDFAIWAGRFNTTVADCAAGSPQDCRLGADINGDGIQDTADFTAIQLNFFATGDAAGDCPPVRPHGIGKAGLQSQFAESDAARWSVPVSSLTDGLRTARRIDVNGDGVIDQKDVREFARAHGLPLLPQFQARLRRLEANSIAP